MGLRGRRGSGPGRAALGRAGLVLAVLLAAGVVSTWPALRDARSDFLAEAGSGTPIEGGVKAGDHLQTIWQLWLPGHQLRRGERLWIDPYSFQPEVEPRINFAGWPFSIVFGPLEWALGTVLAWNVFVLLGYLGAGGLAFLWLRSLELSTGAALLGAFVFALAPYRAAQAGAGHLLAWISMLLPLSLWALERRWYWLSTAALASIPLSGQVHLALGAIPFFAAYALVRGGKRRWAAVAVAASVVALLAVWSWLAAVLAAGVAMPMALALGANLPGYEAVWDAVPALGATRVPGRLMPIACLSLAGLAALAASRLGGRLTPLVLLGLLAVDLRAGVTAYEPAAADEHNRAYAALRERPGGRLLEMPVRAPDRQEASVYLYYAMQAPRERPAGYSTIAPKKAARVLRELQPCADARHLSELGVRYLAVVGPPECGVAGRLLARDGPVALYAAYIPVAW